MMVYINRLSDGIDRQVCFNFFPTANAALSSYKLPNNLNKDLMAYFQYRHRLQLSKQDLKKISGMFEPGTIMSMSESGATRGLTTSTLRARHLGGYLKNNTSLSICIRRGEAIVPMHANLSRRTIHVCGSKNAGEAAAVCGYVLQHMNELQQRLNHIKTLTEEQRQNTLNLMNLYKGPLVKRYYQELVTVTVQTRVWKRATHQRRDDTLLEVSITHDYLTDLSQSSAKVRLSAIKWLMQQPDVVVKRKRNKFMTISYEAPMKNWPGRIEHNLLLPTITTVHAPEGVDPLLYDTMMRNIGDFDSWQGWNSSCRLLLQSTFCCSPETRVLNIQSSLVNSNLHLPFAVRLSEMAVYFEQLQYAVKYNNQVDDYVSLFFPYITNNNICRKSEDDAVEIMVYSSGKTIISGPSIMINQSSCDAFLRLIGQFKDARVSI